MARVRAKCTTLRLGSEHPESRAAHGRVIAFADPQASGVEHALDLAAPGSIEAIAAARAYGVAGYLNRHRRKRARRALVAAAVNPSVLLSFIANTFGVEPTNDIDRAQLALAI